MGDFKLDIKDIKKAYEARRRTDEPQFLDILRQAGNNNINDIDPLRLPPEVGGNISWDYLDPGEASKIFGGMARNTLLRVTGSGGVPFFERMNLRREYIEQVTDISDLLNVMPPMSKDDIGGTLIRGFRQEAISNGGLFLPRDLVAITEAHMREYPDLLREVYGGIPIWRFGSGGSRGPSTATTLSFIDLEMESYSSAFRCKLRGGLLPGMKFLTLYNETHKGGKELIRVGHLLGLEVTTKDQMTNEIRAKDLNYDAESKKDPSYAARAWNRYIKEKGFDVVAGVQPPTEFMTKNAKGNMVTFMDIYNADPSAFETVKVAFITGFPVPQDITDLLRSKGIHVFTTWGATEAMAIGTYPLDNPPSQDVNDLVRVDFPNIGILARYTPEGKIIPAKAGEDGILFITNIFRIGSFYACYIIGDHGTATNRGYLNINRLASLGELTGSCGTDALRVN